MPNPSHARLVASVKSTLLLLNCGNPRPMSNYRKKNQINGCLHVTLATFLVSALAGCAGGLSGTQVSSDNDTSLFPRAVASAPVMRSTATRAQPDADARVESTRISVSAYQPQKPAVVQLGTGEMFQPAPVRASKPVPAGPPVTLSFENGDIREIIRNILGDLLAENYIIDPRVQGTVTMRTTSPVPRADVLPLLETILRANNVGLVRDGNYWRVLPLAEATRGNVIPAPVNQGSGAGRGASIVIYPVKHIGAKELLRVIEPFSKDPAMSLRVDELRNLLFVSGPQIETDRLLEIAGMFDVNLLAGMSFALYTLQNSDVKTVMADYDKIVGGAALNPFGGLLRVLPIERMNAILLVSPQAGAIQDAKIWFERLDAGGGETGSGQKLFVYNLMFTQAEKLQPILQAAISGRALATTPQATVAPGQFAATLFGAPVSPLAGQSLVQAGNTFAASQAQANAARVVSPTATTTGANTGAAGQGNALARNATITADKDRNALLIVASQAEYNSIEAVIRKLDIAPKQVAIEVQIAEVSLKGDFEFGLQTFFQGKLRDPQNRMTSENGLGQIVAGAFTYTWKKTDAIKAIINLSESKNKIRTISQPTLITLENQKASFQAGTQISVRTQTSTATVGTTGSVDSYQYISTGINVAVTPRVSGDNVFLEIQQEISDAGVVADGNPNPPITKRSASTNVMIGSGDTMLMGGLFQEGARTASSGLPFLSSVPVVGGLFGSQTWQSDRTELVLLITPRILASVEDTRGVVDELRKRLKSIEAEAPSASTKMLPTSGVERKKLADEIRALDASMSITPTVTPKSNDAVNTVR